MSTIRTLSGFVLRAARNIEYTTIPAAISDGVPISNRAPRPVAVKYSKSVDLLRSNKDYTNEEWVRSLIITTRDVIGSFNRTIRYELSQPKSAMHVRFLEKLLRLVNEQTYFDISPYKKTLLYDSSENYKTRTRYSISSKPIETEIYNILSATPATFYDKDIRGPVYLMEILDILLPAVHNRPGTFSTVVSAG